MRKRSDLLFLMLFALYALSSGRIARAQLLTTEVNARLRPLPGVKAWGKTPAREVFLPLHCHTRIRPTALLVGRDHPNGVQFLALFPGEGVSLPLKFSAGFAGFDTYGELRSGYTIEVAEHDFAHDGMPTIVVAVGNGRTDLALNIVRYHAPRSARNAARPANWTLIGSYSGQTRVEIEGRVLRIPIGAQGRYEEFTWIKGRFHKTR